MKLSTSTNILFERENGEHIEQAKAIELCAKAGYKILDFCFHDLITYKSPFLEEKWEKYIDLMIETANKNNICFGQSHAIVYDFCRQDIDHEFLDKIMRRCIVSAGKMGIHTVVVHPSTDRSTAKITETSKRKNIEYLSKLTELAEKHATQVAIENMWDYHIAPLKNYASTAEEVVDLADSVQGLGICWDAEHAAIMKQNQKQSLELIGDRLTSTHISDYTNTEDIHLLPYMGKTDWPDIMGALAHINYKGEFNFEIHRYLTKMPMSAVPAALELSVKVGEQLIEMYNEFQKHLKK